MANTFSQEEHHRRKTFKQEYIELLEEFEQSFEERYLFEWIDDMAGHAPPDYQQAPTE